MKWSLVAFVLVLLRGFENVEADAFGTSPDSASASSSCVSAALNADPQLSAFTDRAVQLNVTALLDVPATEFTIFAPSNAAMAEVSFIPDEEVDALVNVIQTHVVPGTWTLDTLYSGQVLDNVFNQTVTVICSNGTLDLSADSGGTIANVTLPPEEACNALIYTINKVLIVGDAVRAARMAPLTGSEDLQDRVMCDGSPWPVDLAGAAALRWGFAAAMLAFLAALLI